MASALLRIEELGKSFSAVRALDDVDIEVRSGEVLGLVGPNGSGKTTLFNCVTGFVRPTSGRIHWQDREITKLAPDQIARRGIIRTFQQKMVFPRATVRENLDMAWRRHRNGASEAFTCCEDIISFLGLDEMEEKLATDIPFGSARKLGVGLALAASPALLLLDEPAAGLNTDESRELGDLIRKITDLGVTVWVIEHDMALVMSISDRITVLDAGRKIAEGKPADIANHPEVISVYLGEKFAKGRSAQ
jgi:ABC-type branched-subunit amino acid transport system ATPase component